MHIRDNVRRRRQERISQLLGQKTPDQQGVPPEQEIGKPAALFPSAGPALFTTADPTAGIEPDPELWWKEQQRQRRTDGPAWSPAGRILQSPKPTRPPTLRRHSAGGFVKSFFSRLAIAVVIYGAVWGWFASGLPGSAESKTWTIDKVTQDMDFQAARVWYERTFGGSPAFLPIFRNRDQSQAVSGTWSRRDAVLPINGRVVQTFAQDGGGVRIAAGRGSGVQAVYAGRVLQVAAEDAGKATVLIQHAGRIVTVYGNLEQLAVRPNDWVEAGQRLGTLASPSGAKAESLLYFAVKRDGKTIDPAEVVPFD